MTATPNDQGTTRPVVHFEIIGKEPGRLRSYYGDLVGWEFDTPSPVAHEVSEPEGYGFLELVTTDDGTGIRGGIGGGEAYQSHAIFYVASRTSKRRCYGRKASEGRG